MGYTFNGYRRPDGQVGMNNTDIISDTVLTVRSVSEIMSVLFRVLPAHQMLPQPSADRYRAVSHFRIIRDAARCRRILKELRTH